MESFLSRAARALAGVAAHARLQSTAAAAAESVPSGMPVWRARRFAALRARGPRAPLPPVVEPGAPHIKFKSAFKRASSVMADVNREAWARMQLKMAAFRPPLPNFNPGDAIEIQYGAEVAELNPVTIRGTVISKRNKGVDTKFTIINSMDDEWYRASYPFASPLLRTVRVMMRNRHSEGATRARRAKLFYLLDKDPKHFLVDHNTKEPSERAAERVERRALQKAGKVYRKGLSESQLAHKAANEAAKSAAGGAAAGGKVGGKTAAKAGAKGKKD